MHSKAAQRAPISRSENMRRVRAKDTKPELLLRRTLFARGKRFRLHAKELPGKPDLVFRKARVAVFIHGCFWHQHENCIQASTPKTNRDYWVPKLAKNVERDARSRDELEKLGFRTAVLWECEIEASPEEAANLVEHLLTRQVLAENTVPPS
jgi:DNA mismatch endonuclease (patch repair protein)